MPGIERLTESLFEEYGNRKKVGRLSIVVDTESFVAYAVPIGVEHIDFLRAGFGKEDSKFVPVHIDLNSNYDVEAIITGESGVEQGYGVRHTSEQLDIAHQKALELVANSPFLVLDNCDYRKCFEYVNFK